MRAVLVIILATTLVAVLPSCQSDDINEAQELWELFTEYTAEILLTDQLCEIEIEEAWDEMRAGEMDMRELGERIDELYITQANTIRFIDIHPKYDPLYELLWKEQEPPTTHWELGDELYVMDYIDLHYSAIGELADWFRENADEFNIDLDYRPSWMKVRTP